MKNKSELRIDRYGTKEWILNGKLHREDGPAVEWLEGTKEWYLNDERHRINGPAVEYTNGDKFWYLNGKLHRIDGPAIECANGSKGWFLNGKKVTEKDMIVKINLTEREYLKFVINL